MACPSLVFSQQCHHVRVVARILDLVGVALIARLILLHDQFVDPCDAAVRLNLVDSAVVIDDDIHIVIHANVLLIEFVHLAVKLDGAVLANLAAFGIRKDEPESLVVKKAFGILHEVLLKKIVGRMHVLFIRD